MIARVFRGTGFAGLQAYLLRGHSGDDTYRVLWTSARNLATDDPERAAPRMRATAERSTRTEKPVWHLTLSAEPGAELNREKWERMADRLLGQLGLEEHQVLIVAHGDTRHPHIHLMVNRVHPDPARAWSTSHDYRRIEKVLRQLERDFGLRQVPGHHSRGDRTAAPDRSASRTPGETRHLRRTGEASWSDRTREALRAEFREASSWADLRDRLQQRGYRLESRGPGIVVTDGERSIKASRIARSASAHQLAARFGQSYPEWSRALHDTLTAATEVKTAGELLTAAERFAAAANRLHRAANEARQELHVNRLRSSQEVDRFGRNLADVYRDPSAALRALVRHHREQARPQRARATGDGPATDRGRLQHERGWRAVAKVLEESPQTFGKLRAGVLSPGRRDVRTAAHRAAHSARALAHLRPNRARLAARARRTKQAVRDFDRRSAARQAARVAHARLRSAQRNLVAAVRRGSKDLAAALPPEARRAVTMALRLTQHPKRTLTAAAVGRLIPRGAAAAALAFGASAAHFAAVPSPVTAAKASGAAVRALGQLSRDSESERGR
jgi:hypothetical protein